MHFFLGSDQDDNETEPSDDDEEAILLSYPCVPPLNNLTIGSRFEDVTTPPRD